jgi:cytidyltransferase-like protein
MRIFCDGVFDLFHSGHVNHFKSIKDKYPNSYLLVGIMTDKDAEEYKRKPIHNKKQRTDFVNSCKYVDETILEYPDVITKEFMEKNNIDLIVHAFSDDTDISKQKHYYEYPISIKKFETIKYDNTISTTNILNNTYDIQTYNEWHKIWEKKGNENFQNLKLLGGYEDTESSSLDTYNNIQQHLKFNENSKILEIGCGAGGIAQHFKNKSNYYGTDYSRSLCNKHINLLNNKVFNCEANHNPFKNKFFDYTFVNSVFEYFDSHDYAKQVINDIERMTKHSVYILNMRHTDHTHKKDKHKYEGVFKHILYTPKFFEDLGFTILPSTYESEYRFSVFKHY